MNIDSTSLSNHTFKALCGAARKALDKHGQSVPSGVGAPKAMGRYIGAEFRFGDAQWVVCETSLASENAQLLDATVAFKADRHAQAALAILHAPNKNKRAKESSTAYAQKYRASAWHGLGVLFVTEQELGSNVDFALPTHVFDAEWLESIVGKFKMRLQQDLPGKIEKLRGSRQAEAEILPLLDEILVQDDFKQHGKSYQSFWRRPQADGVWIREAPQQYRVHLEVKLTEDDGAPFCQVFEGIGIADAVIQVRLVAQAMHQRLSELNAQYPWLADLKVRVARELPIRFIEIYSAEELGAR